jgi:type I restriction enzyme S subunit
MSNIARKRYKERVIDTIPDGWEIKWLNEVLDYSGGSQPPKRTFSKENKEGYLRLYQIRDYTGSQDRPYYIPEENTNKTTDEGDILIARYGASLGQIFWAKKGAYNVAMAKVIQKDESTLKEYLYHYLNSKIFQNRLAICTRAAQSGFNKQDWSTFIIPVPPLPEQKKIAAILSIVDKAIEKTEDLIEESKQLKKGLMQELLTKGIGHSEFKEVEVGGRRVKIPVEWELKRVEDCADINQENLSTKTDANYEIEYIDISSIEETGVISNTSLYKYKEAPSRAKRIVNKGDVILSTVRPYLKAFALIEREEENLICSTGYAVLTAKENVDEEFLYHSVCGDRFVSYLSRLMRGTSYPAVNNNDVKITLIPLPPLEEQKKIARILSCAEQKIQKKREYKESLEELKKGLMQKLLTGEVRV